MTAKLFELHKLSKISCLCAIVLAFSFIFAFPIFESPEVVNAQANTTINFQSKIVNLSTGTNLSSGSPACIVGGADTCDFRASIYSDPAGGTLLWQELHSNVELGDTNGIFNLSLNSTCTGTWAAPASPCSGSGITWGSDTTIYIQIEFDPSGNADFSEGETFSRKLLSSVPYAYYSDTAGNLDTGTFTQGSVIFANSSGQLAEDNANFYWDDSGNILYLGGTGSGTADISLGADGSAVFNEQSNDVDFRIEGNNDANLFFADGGIDTVFIGTNTDSVATAKLYVKKDFTGGSGEQAVALIDSALSGDISASTYLTYSNATATPGAGNTISALYNDYNFLTKTGDGILSTLFGSFTELDNLSTSGSVTNITGNQIAMGLLTGSTTTTTRGYYSQLSANGSLTDAYLYDSSISVGGTTTNSYGFRYQAAVSGTLSNSYAFRINNATGAGTLTNQYGLYIENLTKGGTTDIGLYIAGADTYAIHVDSGISRFDGNIQLGSDANNALFTGSTGSGGTSDLYYGNDLLCDVSETNCGWATIAQGTLWTDGGAFAYLTATGDDVVIGSNSAAAIPSKLYISKDYAGTAEPSTISNITSLISGNITDGVYLDYKSATVTPGTGNTVDGVIGDYIVLNNSGDGDTESLLGEYINLVNASSGTTSTFTGVSLDLTNASNTVSQVSGVDLFIRGNGGNYTTAIGFMSEVSLANGSTITDTYFYDTNSSASLTSALTNLTGYRYKGTLTGTSTNSYGFRANNITGTGTLTNQYGLYIENLTKGGTTDIGIYIAGADTYAMHVDAGTVRLDADLIVGGNTSATESIAGSSFTQNGDDLFVAGMAGIEGDITTDADLYLQSDVDTTGAGDISINFGGTNSEILMWDDGTDAFVFTDDVLPSVDDSFALGSNSFRWSDVYVGPATVHIGTSTTDEGTIAYNTSSNILGFSTDSTTNADIAFFTDDLYLDKSLGAVGITTASPQVALQVGDALGTPGFSPTPSGGLADKVWVGNSNAATSGDSLSFVAVANQTADTTGSIQALEGYTLTTHASGTVVLSLGTIGNNEHLGAGTVTTARGIDENVFVSGSGSITTAEGGRFDVELLGGSSGNITNAYGLVIDITDSGAGSITTTSVGIRIEDLDGAVTPYGIYQAGTNDNNFFAGNVEIDGTTQIDGAFTIADIAVNGDDITSDGNLTINATGYTRIGDSATPGTATGDDDLYVQSDLEIDGILYLDGTIDTIFTAGSVVFAGTNGVLTEDNANFFFDDTNNDLLIGGTSAAAADIFLGDNGSATFNEQAASVTFRVEGGTGYANLFEVIGSSTAASNRVSMLGKLMIDPPDVASNTEYRTLDIGAYTQTIAADFGDAHFTNYASSIITAVTTTRTVTNAATVYIQNATSATGTAVITNNYALWIDGGVTRLDGNVIIGGGTTPGQELEVDGDIRLNSNGTATTNGLCHSGTDVDGATFTDRDIVACNDGPNDLAEWYAGDSTLVAGDITQMGSRTYTYESSGAVPETGIVYSLGQETINVMERATNSNSMIGIISTAPWQTFGSDIKVALKNSADPTIKAIPIALKGRVPVNMAPDSPAISAGDSLTLSSTYPGKATKANSNDVIVGKALQSWSTGIPQLLVYISDGVYDPSSTSGSPSSPDVTTWDEYKLQNGQNLFALTDTITSSTLQINVSELIIPGSVTVQGNLTVAGLITTDSLEASNVTTNNLSTNRVTLNNNSGTVTVIAGQTIINVPNIEISINSVVNVTPDEFVQYKVVKTAGIGFDIILSAPVATNVQFDYIIVE